jgi:hypothetical protein
MPGPAPEGGFDSTSLRKELVKAIYEDHNPEKLGDVDGLLASFVGREDELLTSLRDKYHVQDHYKVEDPNKEWGKAANKLEVLLVIRLPSRENRDKTRVVPGRPSVYIVPRTDCEPGAGSDTNVYLPNRAIEHVFILQPPDSPVQQRQLDTATRVLCKSDRDGNGAMTDMTITELHGLEQKDDKLIDDHPAKPWCPVVVGFTATVAQPLKASDASMRAHRQIQDAHTARQLWPENISRFSQHEMAAAVRTIDDSVPQAYSLAYFFTSSDEASELFKGSNGLPATVQPDGRLGLRVSLRSPAELGWEKNATGDFLEAAGGLMFGPHWRETNSKQLQAVLILGIPTDKIPADGADTFVILEPLLVTETVDKPYYSSFHIYKSYLLQRTTAADHCSAVDPDQDLQALFALVDADGDGNVSKEEATEYLRKERQVYLDEHSIDLVWLALDEDGNGDLDITEFPRFLEVVEKEVARVAAASGSPATATMVPPTREHMTERGTSFCRDLTHIGVHEHGVESVRVAVQTALGCSSEEEVLRAELSGLRPKELKRRAKDLGIDEEQIYETLDADDPTAAMLELVVSATMAMSTSQPTAPHNDVLSELTAALGVSLEALERALRAEDAQAAVLKLLSGATQGPSDPILAALRAGGESMSDMLTTILEGAVEALEDHSRSSPRKARRPVKDLIERAEGLLDSMDESWCDSVSQTNKLDHLATTLANLQTSSAASSGADTTSSLLELLGCVDELDVILKSSSDPILAALQAGGESLSDVITAVLEGAVEILEDHNRSTPRKARKPVKGLIDRAESVLEMMDESWCTEIAECDELEQLAALLSKVQSSSAESSGLETSSGMAELLGCLDRCSVHDVVDSPRTGSSRLSPSRTPLLTSTRTEAPPEATRVLRPVVRSSTPPREASTPTLVHPHRERQKHGDLEVESLGTEPVHYFEATEPVHYFVPPATEPSDEVSAAEFCALVADGTVPPSASVWQEGMSGWTTLSECANSIEGLSVALATSKSLAHQPEPEPEPALMNEEDKQPRYRGGTPPRQRERTPR